MCLKNPIAIHFFFQKPATLPQRKRLKQFLSQTLIKRAQKREGVLRIIFCSDEALLQTNKDFLKHNYFTDIITFPFTSPGDATIEAELYISVDRVRDNAKRFGSSFRKELHRVVFHGVLHLCGLGDKSPEEIKAMRKAEDALLAAYFQEEL